MLEPAPLGAGFCVGTFVRNTSRTLSDGSIQLGEGNFLTVPSVRR